MQINCQRFNARTAGGFPGLSGQGELELFLLVKKMQDPKGIRFGRVVTTLGMSGALVAFGLAWFYIFIMLARGILTKQVLEEDFFFFLLISAGIFNWWGFCFGCAGLFLAERIDRPSLQRESLGWMVLCILLYAALIPLVASSGSLDNEFVLFITFTSLIMQPCLGLVLIVRNMQLLHRFGLPLRKLLCWCTYRDWLNLRFQDGRDWTAKLDQQTRLELTDHLLSVSNPYRTCQQVLVLRRRLTLSLVVAYLAWGWLLMTPTFASEVQALHRPWWVLLLSSLSFATLMWTLVLVIHQRRGLDPGSFGRLVDRWCYTLTVLMVSSYLVLRAWDDQDGLYLSLHYLMLALWPLPFLQVYAGVFKASDQWSSLDMKDIHEMTKDRAPVLTVDTL